MCSTPKHQRNIKQINDIFSNVAKEIASPIINVANLRHSLTTSIKKHCANIAKSYSAIYLAFSDV